MRNRWSDTAAATLEGVDLLVYATRVIGQEPDLVLWGGGNTSLKTTVPDHVGRSTRVLWIKGSGSDMKTITAKQFTPLRLDDLLTLRTCDSMSDEDMVSFQNRCMLEPGAPKPSIETLLHAFLPAPHIYHTHADAICTLVDQTDSRSLILKIYGDQVPLVSYVRPGFGLSKLVAEAFGRQPQARAMILDKHGLVTWGKTAKEAYLETIRIVTKAERFIRQHAQAARTRRATGAPSLPDRDRRALAASLIPIVRGALSRHKRMIVTFDDSAASLAFANHPDAERLSQIGPFTPDHILHTKPRPLFLRIPRRSAGNGTDPPLADEVIKAVDQYRDEYVRYFERYTPAGVTMLDPYPRVVLVPGVGLLASGKDRRAARITHDLYVHTMQVIRQASAIGAYTALPPQAQCDFEYWPMENFKLSLLPPEKTLSRRIALITGAAGAIGRAIAARLHREGASVILTDVDDRKLRALSDELNRESGEQTTVAIAMDVTREDSVRRAFEHAILAYGGLDILISNAGIARSAPVEDVSLTDWNESLAVNATGHFLVCREAMRLFRRQRLGGTIVVVATKNVLAPGKDFGPYSASKAAQVQLARVLALEGAEIGVRVNMVNPDAVFEGSGLWSPALREARAKAYGIPVDTIETYCANRNLLKVPVTAHDVSDAVVFLASDSSSKTTGAMIPVDGGCREAFPR
jgi:rhamnulose-1-phosphate aldolase/alcohol dehydrogenase